MKARFAWTSIACLAAGSFTARAFVALPPPPTAPPTTQQVKASQDAADQFDLENKPTDDALTHTLKEFRYSGGIKAGIEQWAKAAGVTVSVNMRALEAAGIPDTAPLTIDLHNVRADHALQEIFDQASIETSLGFTVDKNEVIVSTKDDLSSSRFQTVRVYDLGSLAEDGSGDPQLSKLVQTIEFAVASDSWRDMGGTIGSIRVYDERMVINQTHENHKAIHQLIEQLKGERLDRTRMYDVRDLLKAAATQPAVAKVADALITAIKANCGAGTWREDGGSDSSIAVFDGRLYVTAPPGVHEQLEHLLTLMRKK